MGKNLHSTRTYSTCMLGTCGYAVSALSSISLVFAPAKPQRSLACADIPTDQKPPQPIASSLNIFSPDRTYVEQKHSLKDIIRVPIWSSIDTAQPNTPPAPFPTELLGSGTRECKLFPARKLGLQSATGNPSRVWCVVWWCGGENCTSM